MRTFAFKSNLTTVQNFTMIKMMYLTLILCLPLCISARPWNMIDLQTEGNVAPQGPSQLVTTIDSMTVGFTRALKTASPSLTPLLSVASIGYIGYIASVMFAPSVLKEAGVPLLNDFKFEPRSTRTAEPGFIDSMATGFMKDMIGRTEAADILKNTSINAIKDGMGKLKKATRFLNVGLGSLQDFANKMTTFLSPECLSKYMCQVGQFTSLHIPAIGPVLRSINTFDLDDYSQALIDGTSIGDCSAVYFACPL